MRPQASRPGIEFSDDKNQKSAGGSTSGHGGSNFPAAMGIGEGILQSNNKQSSPSKSPLEQSSAERRSSHKKQASPPKDKRQLNLEKANSLLDDQAREEKGGFHA